MNASCVAHSFTNVNISSHWTEKESGAQLLLLGHKLLADLLPSVFALKRGSLRMAYFTYDSWAPSYMSSWLADPSAGRSISLFPDVNYNGEGIRAVSGRSSLRKVNDGLGFRLQRTDACGRGGATKKCRTGGSQCRFLVLIIKTKNINSVENRPGVSPTLLWARACHRYAVHIGEDEGKASAYVTCEPFKEPCSIL